MSRFAVVLPCLCVFPLGAARLAAQVPTASQSSVVKVPEKMGVPDYSHEDQVLEKSWTEQTMQADGTGKVETTSVIFVQSATGVRENGVARLAYSAGETTAEFVYVRVRKPDGRVIETPASDVQDTMTEVAQAAPMYVNTHILELPVRGLEAGDKIEIMTRQTVTKPAAPGQFWDAWSFPRDYVAKDVRLTLRVPKDKYVNVVSRSVQPKITEENGSKVYAWRSAQLEPSKRDSDDAAAKKKPKDKKKDADAPEVEVSTFRSWQELGAWYASLEKDRTVVTPELKAKADELVKGAATDDDKIRAIYSYVAANFRYIGVELGAGKFQPHAAETVLENRYGDCKDKHTLLAALLKAEGFTPDAVLISSTGKMREEIANPAQFDHLITVVEQKNGLLWMDSTPETAPFQLLLAGLRDKSALVVPDGKPAFVAKTPADPPFPMFSEWKITGALDKDGEFKGHFDITMRDDFEVTVRQVYRNTSRNNWDTLTKRVLAVYGFGGDVSNVDASSPEDLTKPFQIHLDYKRKQPSWDQMYTTQEAPLFLFWTDKSDTAPDDDFQVGDIGRNTVAVSITLPSGYSVQLPEARHVTQPFAEFSETFKSTNGVLEVQRTVNVRKQKLDAKSWDAYLDFHKAVDDAYEQQVKVLRPGEKADETVSNPEAVRLLQQVLNEIQAGNLEAAQRDLDEAARLSPDERGVHSMRAYLLSRRGKLDDSIAEYGKELAAHPEQRSAAASFAQYLIQTGQRNAGERMYALALKTAPADAEVLVPYASLLLEEQQPTKAISLLEAPASAKDATPRLQELLARAYVQLGQKGLAGPLLASLMKSDDPLVLNNAAYYSSEGGLMLNEAAAAAQKALDKLAERQKELKLSAVTQNDISDVSLTGSAWDTLGWVYFQQGDVAKAEQYCRSAFQVNQSADIAEHLGEIYEKRGDAPNALRYYRLAVAAAEGTVSEDATRAAAKAKALQATGVTVKEGSDAAALSTMRTVNFGRPADLSGSAEFFILLSANGVEDVHFLSGSDALRDMVQDFKNATFFQQKFPAGSKARLVKKGVVFCGKISKDCGVTLLLPRHTHVN